jgi:hypothetical protein
MAKQDHKLKELNTMTRIRKEWAPRSVEKRLKT